MKKDNVVNVEQAEREVLEQPLVVVKFNAVDITNKIVKFCQAISGIPFYPYQEEYAYGIVYSLVTNDGEEVTALFSRQSGKTETNACVIAGCMVILPKLAELFPDYEPLQAYKDGLWVGIFAPSGDQAETTFSRTKSRIRSHDAKLILRDDDLKLDLKVIGSIIWLTNGSFCTSMSASKNAHIESKTYHLIIIEEAQDADNRVVRKSIHPMGASTNATIIKVGTANDKKSDFLEAIKRNRRKNLNGKRKFHFEYNYKVVQKYNPRYKKFIEKEKERLGIDSDEFRMAYGCEFILERGMFCTEERFEAMCQLVPGLELCHGLKIGTQVAGIDIGKASDPTVVTVADVDWANPVFVDEESHTYYYRKRVLDWLELLGDDHESQFYQIIDFLDKYNIRAIAIDSTGKGDPVADRFKAYYEGRCDVIAMTFSMSSKSRMYKLLNAEIIANRWEIPNGSRVERSRKWRKFKNEMLDLEKSWRGTYMVVHHPNEKDAHDDYPDSLALCNIAAMVEAMGEVEISDNELFARAPRGTAHTSGRKRGRRTG